MRIGIDMRMAGTGEGIARYAEQLVLYISQIDHTNQYFLLCLANSEFQIPNSKNWHKVIVRSKYYSWREQTLFVWELLRLKLDVVHFPSFNAPILYHRPFIATIHDLIHHHYPGKKKLRFFHRMAYRLSMINAVHRSQKIIAVSEFTKKDILDRYKIDAGKISVIYEGVSERFRTRVSDALAKKTKEKYGITKPYILFVGAWRRYKNVPLLARVFDIIKDRYIKDLELVLVGKEDAYYPDIKEQVFSIKYRDSIRSPGFVSDKDLPALYQGASVFVLPSRFEGFGLIAVEAQASGVPAAVSDIKVLREVLRDGAVYFDPADTDDIAKKILTAAGNHELSARGRENSKRYDWKKTAEQTLRLYNETG